MASDWSRSSISDLLTAYKAEENLYNPKHKLYHNKQARNKSWDKILAKVQKSRPESNCHDLNKKIQTIRTQYGQEVSKMQKSAFDEHPYIPKIWWFEKISWIGQFMTSRNDRTPLSEKTKQIQRNEVEKEPILFHIEDVTATSNSGNLSATEIEFAEYDSSETQQPPAKKLKTYEKKSKIDDEEVETVYTLLEEEQFTSTLDSNRLKIVNEKPRDLDKNKRRSKTFGKYVAALLIDIDDDKVFFELQSKITKAIHDAISGCQ